MLKKRSHSTKSLDLLTYFKTWLISVDSRQISLWVSAPYTLKGGNPRRTRISACGHQRRAEDVGSHREAMVQRLLHQDGSPEGRGEKVQG